MGPGFDSIGIALNLYNRFSMEECDCIDISATGGERIPNDETNLVYQCAKRVYDICGKPMPGLPCGQHVTAGSDSTRSHSDCISCMLVLLPALIAALHDTV